MKNHAAALWPIAALAAAATLAGCSADATASRPEAGARGYSHAQATQHAKSQLEAVYPGIDLPEVAAVRFISADEFAQTRVDCLSKLGFSANVMEDGGVEFDDPPAGQAEALAIANYTCALEYPVDPAEGMMTGSRLRTLYDYYVDVLVPCLENEGYEIDTVPSWTVFNEQYATAPWSPYTSVYPSTQEGWDEINDLCPQGRDSLD